jgi:predicted metal-dependent hydrolase
MSQYWCQNDPVRTHFYDGWSILFPAWERAFVCVAEHHKGAIKDQDLRQRIDTFCKQELAHARAHQAHNKTHGLAEMEAKELKKARLVMRRPNHQMWLATMVSIEHMAACGARTFLRRYEGQSSKELNLFKWHCREELEHKSLAMDLWLHLGYPRSQLKRVAALNMFYVLRSVMRYTVEQCKKDGVLWKLSSMKSLLGLGMELVFKSWIPYTEIFRNDFHPDNHNDQVFLQAAP